MTTPTHARAARRLGLAALALLLLALVLPGRTAAQEGHAVEYDVLLLVDITASMRGDGPNSRDIWPEVAAAVTGLIDRLAPGTNVAVVPFDAGPRWGAVAPGPVPPGGDVNPLRLDSEATRNLLKLHVGALPVDGQQTHIYESLEYGLRQLQRWRQATPGVERRQSLFLYTDGQDNGPHAAEGVAGLAGLVKAYQDRTAPAYVVYHDLGAFLSPADRQLLEGAGVTVAAGPPPATVSLETPGIELGELEPGGEAAVELRFSSSFADVFGRPLRLSVQTGGTSATVAPAEAALAPAVRLTLRVADGAEPGVHTIRVVVEAADGPLTILPQNVAALTFRVPEPPPPAAAEPAPGGSGLAVPWAALAAAALGALGLVAVGALVVTARRRQWGPFRRPDVFHRLLIKEGSAPRSFVELGVHIVSLKSANGHARWVIGAGSRDVPLPPADGVRQQHALLELDGRRLRLVPLEGVVLVEGRPLPPAGGALAEGAVFEIGPYHLRYDRVVA
ncbi:MAG TPA: VWA domain-containing protein [Dehalococcoidia bacterium]